MPSITCRCTARSRRGQVMPVKARSTSSWSVSSISQRAILATSPLAWRSDEPRPSNTTPVVVGSGMSSSLMHLRRLRRSTSRMGSHAVRCGPYRNSVPGQCSRACSMASGISIFTWPAAFRMSGSTSTRRALRPACCKPSCRLGGANSMKHTSIFQPGWRVRHWATKRWISSLPSGSREPWPMSRMVSSWRAPWCVPWGVAGVCIRKSPWAWQAHWPCESGG